MRASGRQVVLAKARGEGRIRRNISSGKFTEDISLSRFAHPGSLFSILFLRGIIPCPPVPLKHDEEERAAIPEESLCGWKWRPHRMIRQGN